MDKWEISLPPRHRIGLLCILRVNAACIKGDREVPERIDKKGSVRGPVQGTVPGTGQKADDVSHQAICAVLGIAPSV